MAKINQQSASEQKIHEIIFHCTYYITNSFMGTKWEFKCSHIVFWILNDWLIPEVQMKVFFNVQIIIKKKYKALLSLKITSGIICRFYSTDFYECIFFIDLKCSTIFLTNVHVLCT
jgi:hypothetical protein